MEIFEEALLSFKMKRKSRLASKLKSSISDQLFNFLGEYTDDVLAEYITVLVCNGKHQIQAKDDLEAFLGERSGAFVSWLWGHLFQYGYAYKNDSPSSCGASTDLNNMSEEVHAHKDAYTGSSLTKNGNNFHKTSRVSPDDIELSENGRFLETTKEQSRKYNSVSCKAVDIAEKLGGDTLKASTVTTEGAHSFERAGKYQSNENRLACQVSDFPGRVMGSKRLESSAAEVLEIPHGRETYAANVSATNSLNTFADVSSHRKMSRGSVWDRLGKPLEENSVVNDKSLEAYAGAIVKKHYETEDQPKLLLPTCAENFNRNVKYGVHVLDKSYEADICSSKRKHEQGASKIVEPHSDNNIRHKRTYYDVSSSVDQQCDDHFKENSHDLNKLTLSTEAVAAPVILSEMKDVKQKLQRIEMEMSKIRSKQPGMNKEGQPPVLSSSGVVEYSVEDVNSRTVFASNVHFAVTKEVLSSHFAKCGAVSSVILPDNVKGSAYITFASKDSVEKAVALNGTSFYSRSLKVVKKGEEPKSTIATKPPLNALKPPLIHSRPVPKHGKTSLEKPSILPRVHHHLQWRRGTISSST